MSRGRAALEALLQDVEDEVGALPLVENALTWLWDRRRNGRLDGQLLTDQGGPAGILSRGADDLLASLEDARQRETALELLFWMVQVDPQGRRHTRRRISLADAEDVAGHGIDGRALIDRLAGRRSGDGGRGGGPLRLITITEARGDSTSATETGRWVDLIHETLIRSRGTDAEGNPQPFWPTLWTYIDRNRHRATRRERLLLLERERRERLQLRARRWQDRRGIARLFGLANWGSLFGYRRTAAPGSVEARYLRWSRVRASVQIAVLAALASVPAESLWWTQANDLPLESLGTRWSYLLGAEMPFPAWVEVPAGEFLMGGPQRDEQPAHSVVFDRPITMGKTEVTFEQYDAFIDATGRSRPSDEGWGRDDRPVINIDWEDARAYARWLGAMTGASCRLPSEAEWEYAARAGTTTAYAFGDQISATQANIDGLVGQTSEVGSYPANDWGLHDMHGNVWEWVEDCWHDDYTGAPEDGRPWLEEDGGNCNSRVLRGGSWGGTPDFARAANRSGANPVNRYDYVGFRVVCSSPSLVSDP